MGLVGISESIRTMMCTTNRATHLSENSCMSVFNIVYIMLLMDLCVALIITLMVIFITFLVVQSSFTPLSPDRQFIRGKGERGGNGQHFQGTSKKNSYAPTVGLVGKGKSVFVCT